MILTIDPIDKLLQNGFAEQTPFAQKFIDAVFKTLNIQVIACYFHSSTQMLLSPQKTIEKLAKKGKLTFAKVSSFTIYAHSSDLCDGKDDDTLGKSIYQIFSNLLASENIPIEYPRVYLPEEIRYYGWLNKRPDDWDLAKAIQPCGKTEEIHNVHIERIDHLALWHYLQDSLKTINRCECITKLNARVFCGYDKRRHNMAYHIILPDSTAGSVDRELLSRSFSDYAIQKLKSGDKWNTVNVNTVSPIICSWSDLTEEQKFAIVKG